MMSTTGPIQMSPDQLQALISGFQEMMGVPGRFGSIEQSQGNLSTCGSRFAGKTGESIDAFINAVDIFKDCANVSDENAVKGLPMLLDEQAATWWQGIKSTIVTWEQAKVSLRSAFGINKPPHAIFVELFSQPQWETEATDIFVARARLLLSYLPAIPELHVKHQIDMIYGLLHLQIRQRLPRESFDSFEELIVKARSVEGLLAEVLVATGRNNWNQEEDSQSEREDSSKTLALKFRCYGCGMNGHKKSNCPRCNKKSTSTNQLTLTE